MSISLLPRNQSGAVCQTCGEMARFVCVTPDGGGDLARAYYCSGCVERVEQDQRRQRVHPYTAVYAFASYLARQHYPTDKWSLAVAAQRFCRTQGWETPPTYTDELLLLREPG